MISKIIGDNSIRYPRINLSNQKRRIFSRAAFSFLIISRTYGVGVSEAVGKEGMTVKDAAGEGVGEEGMTVKETLGEGVGEGVGEAVRSG